MIENKKAVGTVFIKNGRKHIVRANQEVIVSGGSVSSPQILLLSGIGPEEHLKSPGVSDYESS
jgi:choline dehydrogenase-like flavoprotein